jgi:O-acetyl-ADP-ribose deacetylase
MKIVDTGISLPLPKHIEVHKDKKGNAFKVEIGDGSIVLHTSKKIHKIPCSFLVNSSKITLDNGGGVNKLIHEKAGKDVAKACMKIKADSHGVRCRPGHAKMTTGGKLKAPVLIHTVGCDYRLVTMKKNSVEKDFGGTSIKLKKISKDKAEEIQTNAYKNSIKVANEYLSKLIFPKGPHKKALTPVDLSSSKEKKLKKIAKQLPPIGITFPTISTNIFKFPKKLACEIAMKTFIESILVHQGKRTVKTFHIAFMPSQKEDLQFYREYINEHFK